MLKREHIANFREFVTKQQIALPWRLEAAPSFASRLSQESRRNPAMHCAIVYISLPQLTHTLPPRNAMPGARLLYIILIRVARRLRLRRLFLSYEYARSPRRIGSSSRNVHVCVCALLVSMQ